MIHLAILSPQERRILSPTPERHTDSEILTGLARSDPTVKNYIPNMAAKWEVKRCTQVVILYLHAQSLAEKLRFSHMC